MAGALELLEAEHEDRQAHEHLMRECPWYRHVQDGGRGHPDMHCRPATGEPRGLHEGGALVKFAARPRTLEEANYRATGSVARNCRTCEYSAEWKGSQGRCTMFDSPVSRSHVCDEWDAEDRAELTPRTPEASTVVKPTVPPGGPGLFHMKGHHLPPYIEHLYPHLVARYGKREAYRVAVGIVKKWKEGINPGGWKTKSGKGKRVHPDVQAAAARNIAEWEEEKAEAHARSAGHGHSAQEEGIGLAATVEPGERPFPGRALVPLPPMPKGAVTGAMFAAHRLDDLLRDFAHANERLRAAKADKRQRAYHMIHVNNHLSHALDEAHAWAASLKANFPAEAKELDALTKTIGLAKAVSPAAKAATYAHLLETVMYHAGHAKRHALVMTGNVPDKEWAFNYDHAATHAKGAMEHCFKLAKHLADNYPETARWFKELEDAEDPGNPYTGLAAAATAPGARPFLVPPTPGARYTQYGMYQNPVQSVSPSPPLPPLTALPTAAEVRAVIPLVPECSDASLSDTARKFLEQAAGKLEKNDPLAALPVMRSAQTALYAAHKADQGTLLPSAYTANVFARTPPAGQSSATAAMKQSVTQVQRWRKAEQALGALTDRIRKRYFHGVFAGPSQMARFTESEEMTALDKVLALAGERIVTGKDVSEPVESDTSGAAPLLQEPEGLLDIADPDAARELAALPVAARARVTAYLERARAMAATNRFGASQSALRAMMAAKEAGAHDLARHIHEHVRALAEGGNLTNRADTAARMQAGDRAVSPQDNRQAVADTGNRAGLSAVDALLAAAGA